MAPPGKGWREHPAASTAAVAGAPPEPPTGAGGARAGWVLPSHGDHLSVPTSTQPTPQQCRGAGPFAGSGQVSPITAGCFMLWQEAACPACVTWPPAPHNPGASFAEEPLGAFWHAGSSSLPVARLLQLVSSLPQLCTLHPPWPPRANPASPWGAEEGGGSPGTHRPEEEGDLGMGRRVLPCTAVETGWALTDGV